MLIEDWMRHPVHTVKPLDSIAHARAQMTRHRVNQLPVVRDAHLVGIVTDRDLRDAFPSVFDEVERQIEQDEAAAQPASRRRRAHAHGPTPESVPVEMVMTQAVVSLAPGESVEDAASLMRRQRIGAVPIAEQGRLVGILTRSDILDAFLALARAGVQPDGC